MRAKILKKYNTTPAYHRLDVLTSLRSFCLTRKKTTRTYDTFYKFQMFLTTNSLFRLYFLFILHPSSFQASLSHFVYTHHILDYFNPRFLHNAFIIPTLCTFPYNPTIRTHTKSQKPVVHFEENKKKKKRKSIVQNSFVAENPPAL